MNQNFTSYKTVKTIQLLILSAITICLLAFLLLNGTLRKTVYTNPSLFTLCALLWILLLMSFVFLIYDFNKLALLAVSHNKLQKAAYYDDLTGIPNHYSCDMAIQDNMNSHSIDGLGLALFTITNLKEINDIHGRESGNNLLIDFSSILEAVGENYGFVCRNSGNVFMTAISGCDRQIMQSLINELTEKVNAHNTSAGVPLEIGHTYILNSEEHWPTFSDLTAAAYEKLL